MATYLGWNSKSVNQILQIAHLRSSRCTANTAAFVAIIRDAVWQARSGYGTVCALKSYIHRPKTMARMDKVAEYQNSHEMRALGREQLGLFI